MKPDPRVSLMSHEFKMSMKEYLSKEDLVEELRLLAESMSTHSVLAAKMGIKESCLSDILAKRRDPSAKVLKFLKVEKVVMYKEE